MQDEAVAAVHAARAEGVQRAVVVIPTGGGKTRVFGRVLRDLGGRAVVLAHRDELVQQACDKIREVWPAAGIGVVKAERDDVHARVVVASVQTLMSTRRVERLLDSCARRDLFTREHAPFGCVVVDEMHHYVADGAEANGFGGVLRALGAFEPGGPFALGVTATPERSSGALGATWERIVYQRGILDGILNGWLVEPRAKQIKLARADFRALKESHGKISDEQAGALLVEADAPHAIARAWREQAAGMRTLVFTPTVMMAHLTAQAFRQAGVAAEALSGETPEAERRAILRRLHTGETLVVPNAQVLTEGFDEPAVSCVVMARPTKSRVFAIQCIGRALRLHPGKQHALILDVVGSTLRMDLVTVAALFGIEAGDAEHGVVEGMRRKKARQQRAEEEAQLEEATADVLGGRIVAVDVALFKARDYAWYDTPTGYALTTGAGRIEVRSVGEDRFDVVRVEPGERVGRERVGRRLSWTETTLYRGIALDKAQAAAEGAVSKQGHDVLARKDASWRTLPASEGQVRILGAAAHGKTRGECSDMISRRFAQRSARA